MGEHERVSLQREIFIYTNLYNRTQHMNDTIEFFPK